jgi:hypothetical protein
MIPGNLEICDPGHTLTGGGQGRIKKWSLHVINSIEADSQRPVFLNILFLSRSMQVVPRPIASQRVSTRRSRLNASWDQLSHHQSRWSAAANLPVGADIRMLSFATQEARQVARAVS